jgi:hypothetical protein
MLAYRLLRPCDLPTQVIVRVCAEKAGGVREAFEKTLDSWLGLYGTPALSSAVKKMAAAKAAAK